MKRLLLLVSLVTLSLAAFAQDYAPVRAGDTVYFKDGFGTIQSVALTEVQTDGSDTILIPFHQVRQKENGCFNPLGEHWLGRIVKKPGGEFLMIVAQTDTLRILSNAGKGDSWIFRSAGNLTDTAYVTEETTKTFLGITDSVKVIKVGRNRSYRDLWLSKKYGFLRYPEVYPYLNPFNIFSKEIPPEQFFFYLDSMIGHSRINPDKFRINFHMIYDINPGDELHVKSFGYYSGWNSTGDSMIKSEVITKEIRNCIGKVETPDTIWIEWKRRAEHISNRPNTPFIHKVWEDTIVEVVSNAPMYNALPGQTTCNSNSAGIIFMPEVKFPFSKKVTVPQDYTFLSGYWPKPDTCERLGNRDGCLADNQYYVGLGGPYYVCNERYSQSGRVLAYYKKGSETSGSPLQIWAVGEREPEKSLQVTVSPNPATEKVHITLEGAGSTGIDLVQIVNLQGKVLFTQQEKSSQSVQLDISELASGVYLVKIYSGERTAFKKIVVAR